jgi:DNA-binding NarL/FixJ family response regulator
MQRLREGILLMHDEPSPRPGPSPSPARDAVLQLRPRHQETLRALLGGGTEKNIARTLGLSQHTVHAYVRAIYGHFGVASRAELLARFIPPDLLGE